MPEEYSKEELWELYESLPEDLQETIFSQETANSIYNACAENGIKDEGVSEISKYVGYVLLGLLPPDEFEKTLKEKLTLENDSAKKISQEITHLVFYPLKETLESIYKTEIALVPKPREEIPKEKVVKAKPKKDTYREPIE